MRCETLMAGYRGEELSLCNLPRRVRKRVRRAVLATCDIRPPDEACENTTYCLSLLADFPEGE